MQILLVSFVSSLVSAQVAAYASLQTISADEFKNSKAEILNKPSEAFERLISAQYQSFIHKMQTPIKNQFYSTPYHPSPENIRKSIKNQKQDIELDEDEDYTDYQHQQGNPDLTLKYDAGEIAGTAGNSLYSLPSQYGMDHAAFALAILAILAGTFMLLFGQRVLKPILFMIGFMILGSFAALFLNTLSSRGMIQLSESTSGWVMIGTIAVGGALGGVLFMSLFSLAAFLLGAAGGLAGGFTVVTLPFAANWGSTVKLIVVVAFVVLGFGVAYLVKKPLLIISTAVIGSFAVFSGIDYFTQTGFGSLLVNDKSRVEFNNGFIGMMAGYAVVAMVSASVHFHLDRKKRGAVSAKYAPAKKEIV